MDVLAPLIGFALAILCVVGAVTAGRRRRLVQDVPTSKTTGVFIGFVELTGTAEAEQPLTSYLAQQPCVHHAWRVEEHWQRTGTETYKDKDGKTQTRTRTESGWQTVASGGDLTTFYLRDDCGVIRIVPTGAKLEPQRIFDRACETLDPLYFAKGPADSIVNSTGRRRFTEDAIPLHAPIFVLGQTRERADVVAPEIAHDEHAEIFLISTRNEKQVSRRFALTFGGLGILGLVLTLAGLAIGDQITEPPRNPRPLWYALAGTGYGVVWLLGWVIMTFNSLIALRQRVTQAWANVDVQLKRRADLIPNLVLAVSALRDHEHETQTAVAEWRSQLAATAPGQAGPDASAITPQLFALAERYPELTADRSFSHLQDTLVETEQRIALARAYFNDIATFYNTRLQVVPDRFLAALGGLQPRALMAANDFERAAVQVNLAT